MPGDLAELRNPDGSLRFWAGSIAVHVFDVDFLERISRTAEGLPFHVARKKVPYLDADGRQIDPTTPNAIKYERFIFDLLPSARQGIVVEVDPSEAFYPVKNPIGERFDSPDTARAAMIALHTRWLREAGATIEPGVAVEISPLFALEPRDLLEKLHAFFSEDGRVLLGVADDKVRQREKHACQQHAAALEKMAGSDLHRKRSH